MLLSLILHLSFEASDENSSDKVIILGVRVCN